jgi:hypothetical protein
MQRHKENGKSSGIVILRSARVGTNLRNEWFLLTLNIEFKIPSLYNFMGFYLFIKINGHESEECGVG